MGSDKMKLANPEDVINYFFYLIPLNETIRAKRESGDLIVYDKYNNMFRVHISIESLTEAATKR